MGIFNKKEKKVEDKPTKKVEKQVAKKAVSKPAKVKKVKKEAEPKKVGKTTQADLSWVLLSPRITEKAAFSVDNKVYVFNVATSANKNQIREAIEKKFNISPIKINVTKVNSKPKVRRGVRGKTATGKKAYVHLNKKDSIEFV